MNTLDRLKDIDIRDMYSGELSRNMTGRCPLPGHGRQSGKTPPFTYRPMGNSFKCHGCGAGGTAIDFYMAMNGLRDFGQAVREMADRYNVPLDDWTPEREANATVTRKRQDVLAWAVEFYRRHLEASEQTQAILAGRGFSPELVLELQLGLADKTLYKALAGNPKTLEENGWTWADLVTKVDERGKPLPVDQAPQNATTAGLIVEKPDGSRYDYFRDRIIFPILKHGRAVGMSGRALPGGADPKYLNLRGECPALFLEDNIRADEAFVCEGLPDTATLHGWGLPACGQQGTGGMHRHAHKFKRTRTVYCCFDTDGAGQEAAIEAARTIHMENAAAGEVRIISLPPTVKDINDFATKGGDVAQFRGLAVAAPTFIDFMLRAIPRDASPVDKERQLREVLSLFLPLGPVQRSHYLKLAKDLTGVGVKDLTGMLERVLAEAGAKIDGPNASGAAKPDIVFDSRRERIPAQDFTFGSPAVGNVTTFLQLGRDVTDDDGNVSRRIDWEPVIVTVTHDAGKTAVDWVPAADAGLTDAEKQRIPFQSVAKGRWRAEAKHPYGLHRFLAGNVPRLNGWTLFAAIRDTFRAHIWHENAAEYELKALYTMQSYVYQLFEAVGYLHLTGLKSSGKSETARLFERLSFNASKSSNQSAAVLFRSIEANCGVRIMDEAERLQDPKPGTPDFDLMLMANDGYKRGAKAERMREAAKGSIQDFTVIDFDLYCPKIIAGINDINPTLASRCIQIPFKRALREDFEASGIREPNRYDVARHYDLRDQLHCWSLQRFTSVREAADLLEEDNGDLRHLVSRDREMWMPLLALALHVDNDRAELEGQGDAARRMGEIETANDLVYQHMIAHQKTKESARRVAENDGSIEIAAIRAVHDLITTDGIRPMATDLNGDFYSVADLAALVTDELKGVGILRADRAITGQRLSSIFSKARLVSESSQRKDVMVPGLDGKRKANRCLALTAEALVKTISRLGGSVETAA